MTAKTVTHTDSTQSTSDLTTYTFSTRSIGTATSDRIVVVCVAGQSAGSTTISTVTVAGNSCTLAGQVASSTTPTGIFYVALASGTTGDVVVTFSGGNARCGIDVFAITGHTGGPTSTDQDTTISSGTVSVTEDFAANSVGIAVGQVTGGSSPTTTWAGLTERSDRALEGTGNCMSASSDVYASQSLGATVSATFTSGSTGKLVLSVW